MSQLGGWARAGVDGEVVGRGHTKAAQFAKVIIWAPRPRDLKMPPQLELGSEPSWQLDNLRYLRMFTYQQDLLGASLPSFRSLCERLPGLRELRLHINPDEEGPVGPVSDWWWGEVLDDSFTEEQAPIQARRWMWVDCGLRQLKGLKYLEIAVGMYSTLSEAGRSK